MKKYAPIIILAAIAGGIGYYLWKQQKDKAKAAAAAGTGPAVSSVPSGTGVAPTQATVDVRTKMQIVP